MSLFFLRILQAGFPARRRLSVWRKSHDSPWASPSRGAGIVATACLFTSPVCSLSAVYTEMAPSKEVQSNIWWSVTSPLNLFSQEWTQEGNIMSCTVNTITANLVIFLIVYKNPGLSAQIHDMFSLLPFFPQVTFCWASMEWIWHSSPTTRPCLCWRLRRPSPRSCCVSFRLSLMTQRKTAALSAETKWT